MAGEVRSPLPDRSRYDALDGLRGIAALLVAAHHLNAETPLFGQPVFAAGLQYVDFFFVLSGFVIAASYGERLVGGLRPERFLLLRLGRIWPAHLVMVGCYLAIEAFVWLSGSTGLTSRPAFGPGREAEYLPLVLVLGQALVPEAARTWNVQSWSISVELVLYVLFALSWRRLGAARWLAAGALCLLGAGMLETGALNGWSDLQRGASGFGLGLLTWACWQAWGTQFGASAPRCANLIEALAIAAVGASFVVPALTGHILAANLIYAAAVLIFAAQRGVVSRWLATAPLAFLGAISYSLYMVHGLAETAALRLMQLVLGGLGSDGLLVSQPGLARPVPAGGWAGDLLALGAIAFAVFAAWLLFRLVEWPARQWSRRKFA